MKSYSLKWLTANTKEIIAFGTVVALSMVSLTQTAHARLIFTTEDNGVNADAYHIDIDDTSADFIDLAFGSGLTSSLRYDILNTKFIFNQNVEFGGKELSDFVVENQATGTAPTCNAGYAGGLYYDTTMTQLLFCDGTTWVSSSAPAANSINSSHIIDGSITADDLGTDSVGSDEIAANAVTASEIATGAVTTTEILDGTIATADLANNAVTSGKIVDGTIVSADLADGAVSGGTGGKITDNSITAADVATGAITSDEILNGTISTVDIASGGNDKLLTTDGSGVVTWIDKSSLENPTLTDGQMIIGDAGGTHTAVDITGDISITNTGVTSLSADSVDSAEIAANAVTSSEISTGAVTTTEILDGTIATADLANNAVTSGKIVDGTIAAADLGADSVTAVKINADVAGTGLIQNVGTGALEVDITNIGDGTTIDDDGAGALEVIDGSITSAKITDGTIVTADLAGDSVTSSKIVDGTIVSADLADGAVSGGIGGKITDNSITADDVATGAITTDEILDGTIALTDIASRSYTEVIAPEFPDFTIQADGTNNRGRLQSDHDNTNNKNYYDWSTRKTTLQDYDLIFQWTVPEGFQSFDANSLAFEYKTTAGSTAENSIQLVEVKDTTGTLVAGASVAAVASTTWANSTAVDLTSGTFTTGERVTLRFKMNSKYSGGRQLAQLGAVKFTYNTK